MPLSNDYSWNAFKEATNIKRKSRGSTMEQVDDALKRYWEGVAGGTDATEELSNLLALVVATNTWLKSKKAKKDATLDGGKKQTQHFVNRWNAVGKLGKA